MNDHDLPRLELAPHEQALAVEESLHDLFRTFATLPGGECDELDSYSRHHAFPSNPMFKGIWGVRLVAGEVDDAVEEALGWQRERGAPFVFWWAGLDAPEGLGSRLEAHGFAPFEIGAPGQVAELDALDWEALERVPDGFRVERVVDHAGLDVFGSTFVEAFEIPERMAVAWVDATRGFGVDAAPWHQYLGWLDDRPVATNIAFCGAGVATVLGIATVADVRGRGIGAAITLAGLAEPRDRGYRYGVLALRDRAGRSGVSTARLPRHRRDDQSLALDGRLRSPER